MAPNTKWRQIIILGVYFLIRRRESYWVQKLSSGLHLGFRAWGLKPAREYGNMLYSVYMEIISPHSVVTARKQVFSRDLRFQ